VDRFGSRGEREKDRHERGSPEGLAVQAGGLTETLPPSKSLSARACDTSGHLGLLFWRSLQPATITDRTENNRARPCEDDRSVLIRWSPPPAMSRIYRLAVRKAKWAYFGYTRFTS
jgi:hypothetical protein